METILFVGGSPGRSRPLSAALAGEYRLLDCGCGREATEALCRLKPSAVLADWEVFARSGEPPPSWLSSLTERVPFIALVDPTRPEQRLHATERGAVEILGRESTIEELRGALARVLRGRGSADRPAAPFIGSSPPILEAAAQIRLYAGSDYPVLILGESGTGKELAARALYEYSKRSRGSFVGRNCAAFPEQLAESELFGTERGAFTDAVRRPGAFELAQGGVLFLDEIGDMSRTVQASLLRALETEEFWPLGAREPRHADIRLVSATGRDLASAAAAGDFRSDLLYRIDTLTLQLPPLRECRGDIPDLAAHFANGASAGRATLSCAAIRKLEAYEWPGNVRQLRNVIRRAVVHARGARELGPEYLQL